uniref:Nuclear mitotic apparatus protein putative n=1 Tax=Albugo laibachii Nc14 TaxID=890382 RepID=F0WX22_9STRA|nr:nuclear mitotic apparatus protein putative [Albugo laibachii Nc14]|eukprot:CCA26011.1 nuclear mitotic apparatus protein putative [Albugo laibachii Nc14]
MEENKSVCEDSSQISTGKAAASLAKSINQEQIIHEMEQKYFHATNHVKKLQNEKKKVAMEAQNLRTSFLSSIHPKIAKTIFFVEMTEQAWDELQRVHSEQERQIMELKSQKSEMELKNGQLKAQLDATRNSAERQRKEKDQVHETLQNQSEEVIRLQQKNVEAHRKITQVQVELETLRQTHARVEKERESQVQHVEWLERNLSDKTKQLQGVRQSLYVKEAELEACKLTNSEETHALKAQLENCRLANKNMEKKFISLQEQLKESQSTQIEEHDQLQNELRTQSRLVSLYKEAAEAATKQVEVIEPRCRDLEAALADAKEALSKETDRTRQHIQHIFDEQSAASENQVAELESKLSEANERLKEMEQKHERIVQDAFAISKLSPGAAEAHLSSHGLTPKQLFDHIVELKETLAKEQSEKGKLEMYLERIVKEVEEKAPVLKNLHLDHQRSVTAQMKVTERLEVCMHELAQAKANETIARREKVSLERKCDLLEQSVNDLSRQIQHLLFRAHDTEAKPDTVKPGSIASENLVLFDDVIELQTRNRQLLKVVRELSAFKKARLRSIGDGSEGLISHPFNSDEEETDSEVNDEVRERLEVSHIELERLRNEREEERKMVAAIVKQRDMYRVLLAQSDSKFAKSEEAVSASCKDSQVRQEKSLDAAANAFTLQELRAEFMEYKEEKQLNVKMLHEAHEKLQLELTQMRMKKTEAEVELHCTKDRLQFYEERCRDAEAESVRLSAKSEQFAGLLLQHEKHVNELQTRLDSETQALHAARVSKESANREVDFCKSHIAELQDELKRIRNDNTSILQLMESTRRLEATSADSEAREKSSLTQRVKDLELELKDVRDKSEAQEALSSANLIHNQHEKKSLENALEQLKKSDHENLVKISRLEEKNKALESKSGLLQDEAAHLRGQLDKGVNVAATERIATLEMELRDAQRATQVIEMTKKSFEENALKYKVLAEANEKSLNELSNASEKWKLSYEESITQLKLENETKEKVLASVRARLKDHVVEESVIRKQLDTESMRRIDAERCAKEAHELQRVREEAMEKQLKATQDEMKALQTRLKIAEENYERELQLHATQVARTVCTRKLNEEENQKRQQLENSVADLTSRLSSMQDEVKSERSVVENELKEAKEALQALKEQNQLLHAQLERSTAQIQRFHDENISSKANVTTVDASNDKEMNDLRGIISFLRRENEISSSKLELSRQETQRFKTQNQTLETAIRRLRLDMQEMNRVSNSNENMEASPSVSGMRLAQLEQLNLLRESNATLRDENERNVSKLKHQIAKMEAIQSEMEPLRKREMTLTFQMETLKEEVAVLHEANLRWKSRVDQLVEKYQQVDPVDFEKVCKERDQLLNDVETLRGERVQLMKELEGARSNEGKSAQEAQLMIENLRKQYDQIKGFAKTWKAKAEAFSKELVEKKKEADASKARVIELEAEIQVLQSKLMENAANNASLAEKDRQEMTDKLESESKRTAQLREFNNRLLTSVKTLKKENAQLKTQMVQEKAPVMEEGSSVSSSSLIALVPEQEPSSDVSTAAPVKEDEEKLATGTSSTTQKPPLGASKSALSTEEKLRMSVLQSMKKQKQAIKEVQESVGANLIPLILDEPKVTQFDETIVEKETTACIPTASFQPPTFAFGSGSAKGLVFGKPGISLPIPSSPTPTSGMMIPVDAVREEADANQAGPGEDKRMQRLARFGNAEKDSESFGVILTKRQASEGTETMPPPKLAKTNEENASEPTESTDPSKQMESIAKERDANELNEESKT